MILFEDSESLNYHSRGYRHDVEPCEYVCSSHFSSPIYHYFIAQKHNKLQVNPKQKKKKHWGNMFEVGNKK